MTRASTRAAFLGLILMLLLVAAVVVSALWTKPNGDASHAAPTPFRVLAPPVPPRGAVVLFSDRQGWDEAMDAAAKAIAEAGETVIGFDTPRLLGDAPRTRAGCIDLSEAIANAAAAALGAGGEDGGEVAGAAPVLAGKGDGATLAYALLAQAPEGLFAGVVPVSFSGDLASPAPLCAGAESEPAKDGVFHYRPATGLPGWLAVVSDHPDAATIAAYAAAADAATIAVRGNFDFPASVITVLAQAHEQADDSEEVGIGALPLVPLPVDNPGGLMAIIYSGDGGWRDADRRLGEALQANGVPVVGVDSLRYFWNAKTPERIAADLALILSHYQDAWGTPKAILIGYSFGADILPFAINRLTPEAKAGIVQISLLGLAERADFAIQVAGWLGAGPSDEALPVRPEIANLDLSRVQCFYGQEEDDSLCPTPALSGAEVIAMPGGHHFDGEYEKIAERIIAGAQSRSAAASPGAAVRR
ncbi:MAG: virulence factor family protein [Rhodospirillales bacterium]|nr:virulence factor family protein [Rhodospirillales bacterium]